MFFSPDYLPGLLEVSGVEELEELPLDGVVLLLLGVVELLLDDGVMDEEDDEDGVEEVDEVDEPLEVS